VNKKHFPTNICTCRFGSVKDIMLLKITSPTARNDASIRLCEVWNKPKQSLGVQEVNFSITYDKLPKNYYLCPEKLFL
jgi:hypothetical protein